MTTIFDQLQPGSFQGIAFPVKSLRVMGGIREHVHEYPHTPGGAPEKLGRKLYEFSISADFTAGLLPDHYKSLWPADLAQLRSIFEAQTTGTLVVPTIGPIQAYCVSWEQTQTAANRSGEEVQMTFREDASDSFLIEDSISANLGSVSDKLDVFKYEAGLLADAKIAAANNKGDFVQGAHQVSLLTRIADVASQVAAIGDQFGLYGALQTSLVDGLVAACREADGTIADLNAPQNWQLLGALHDLWATAQALQKDVQQQNDFLRTFTVPVRMGVGQISAALFGDSSKAVDLMRLNVLPDPLSIEPGTQIHYYAEAA